jgi:hypothetical protein
MTAARESERASERARERARREEAAEDARARRSLPTGFVDLLFLARDRERV